MNEFIATECIRFGWHTFKKRPFFLIGAYILLTIVAPVIEQMIAGHAHGAIGIVLDLVWWAVGIVIGFIATSFWLQAHDNPERVSFSKMWRPGVFWKYVGASVLQAIVIFAGLILFVVPGVIFMLMFMFAGYLAVDQNLGPSDAMRESKRITDGHKTELFWLLLLSTIVVIVGLIAFIVGAFAALPIVMLAQIHALRTLQRRIEPMTVTTAQLV